MPVNCWQAVWKLVSTRRAHKVCKSVRLQVAESAINHIDSDGAAKQKGRKLTVIPPLWPASCLLATKTPMNKRRKDTYAMKKLDIETAGLFIASGILLLCWIAGQIIS